MSRWSRRRHPSLRALVDMVARGKLTETEAAARLRVAAIDVVADSQCPCSSCERNALTFIDRMTEAPAAAWPAMVEVLTAAIVNDAPWIRWVSPAELN